MKKLDLPILIILLISISATTSMGQTSCLPVAWHKLDGNAIDSSGNGNDGVLHGTTPVVDRYGNASSALYFNGSTDYIRCYSPFDYPQRTISLWFKADVFPTTVGIIYNSDNDQIQYGATVLMLVDSSGVQKIKFVVGSNQFNMIGLTNTWYHMAIVVNSTTVKCFINGKLIGSFANSLYHSMEGSAWAIVGCSRRYDRFFAGSLDEVKIYDCVLTDTEIAQLYSNVGIDEINNKNLPVKLYPNPAKDNLLIITTLKANIEISNTNGQILKRIRVLDNPTTIDVSNLSRGMYFLKVKTEKGFSVKKFLKE